MVHARKSAGPKGYKPASGYMYKKTKNGLKVRQVFKPYTDKLMKRLKGGKSARVIRSGGKIIHVSDAQKSGWKRVMKR